MAPATTAPGRPAPAFRLQDQDGVWVELRDLLADGPILLAFYPGDLTFVCTRQLCDYRDAYPELRARGVRVVGVSPDPPARHREFIAAKGFTFRLLSDPGLEAFRAYGVSSRWLPGRKGRGLFVISREGLIVWEKVEATVLTHRGAREVLGVLQALEGRL